MCAQDGNGCKGGWVGQAYRYAATSGLVPKAAWAEMTGRWGHAWSKGRGTSGLLDGEGRQDRQHTSWIDKRLQVKAAGRSAKGFSTRSC